MYIILVYFSTETLINEPYNFGIDLRPYEEHGEGLAIPELPK